MSVTILPQLRRSYLLRGTHLLIYWQFPYFDKLTGTLTLYGLKKTQKTNLSRLSRKPPFVEHYLWQELTSDDILLLGRIPPFWIAIHCNGGSRSGHPTFLLITTVAMWVACEPKRSMLPLRHRCIPGRMGTVHLLCTRQADHLGGLRLLAWCHKALKYASTYQYMEIVNKSKDG